MQLAIFSSTFLASVVLPEAARKRGESSIRSSRRLPRRVGSDATATNQRQDATGTMIAAAPMMSRDPKAQPASREA